VTTGISAYDRARTIQVGDRSRDASLRPGASQATFFPLAPARAECSSAPDRPKPSVDLARLAGLIPAGIICEIMKDDGTMARVPDLIEFCQQHGMKMLTVAELIRYRMACMNATCIASAKLWSTHASVNSASSLTRARSMAESRTWP